MVPVLALLLIPTPVTASANTAVCRGGYVGHAVGGEGVLLCIVKFSGFPLKFSVTDGEPLRVPTCLTCAAFCAFCAFCVTDMLGAGVGSDHGVGAGVIVGSTVGEIVGAGVGVLVG